MCCFYSKTYFSTEPSAQCPATVPARWEGLAIKYATRPSVYTIPFHSYRFEIFAPHFTYEVQRIS